ncbi:glycosyltransferase family 2 protein [Patescibacteria group bacterium]
MELSIIIVSWNVKELLKNCLHSVFQYPSSGSFEVFVVDNASHDGTHEMVKKYFPSVRMISNADNKGFARANNQAIKDAQGELILLLNPDTEVTAGALDKLVKYVKHKPSIGIAGPALLNTNGSRQLSVRSFPTIGSLIMVFLKLHRLFPQTRSIKKLQMNEFNYSKDGKVDQVMGACFLIKNELIKKIGMLDENYFIWFEEVDFCKRAHDNGWEIWYVSDAKVTHHFAKSFGQVSNLSKQLLFTQSARIYSRKHLGMLPWLILTVITPLSLLLAFFQQISRIKNAKY